MFIPTLEITSLIMLLLCTSALYVDTNFEFNVTSVVVIVLVLLDVFPVANKSVVDDVYLGFTNPVV